MKERGNSDAASFKIDANLYFVVVVAGRETLIRATGNVVMEGRQETSLQKKSCAIL